VIGMGMGLDQPFDLETVRQYMSDDSVCRREGETAGGIVDVQNRIDDCGTV
jgi:hypothetical protein